MISDTGNRLCYQMISKTKDPTSNDITILHCVLEAHVFFVFCFFNNNYKCLISCYSRLCCRTVSGTSNQLKQTELGRSRKGVILHTPAWD